MRRKTTTILAVVMTASASIACGGAAETNDPSNEQSGQQPFAGDGTKTDQAPTPTPTGGPAPTTPGAPASPPAAAPAECNKDALNTELSNMALDSALAQHKHFRCLCDDKGFPLVGNINAKGATASQFCSAIKEKGQL